MLPKEPAPRLRRDLQIDLIERDGERFVAMQDPLGIARDGVALPYDFYMLLQIFDGKVTLDDLATQFKQETGEEPDFTLLIENLNALESLGLMESESYFKAKAQIEAEWNQSPERPPICAGGAYPEDPVELEAELESILASAPGKKFPSPPDAVVVPHIDFRVGESARNVYASVWNSVDLNDYDGAIVFGTSHRVSTDYFMLSEKNYETPAGILKTDTELIKTLRNGSDALFKIDERAHRFEHSIELAAVFIAKLAADKPNFTILPVLVGSFFEFLERRELPSSNSRITDFIGRLSTAIDESGKKYLLVASVDFAHIGRKFEDEFDAADKFREMEQSDAELIERLSRGDADGFFQKVGEDMDKWKICGLSPIYSMLRLLGNGRGERLKYGYWDEKETCSGVSFAGLAFFKS